MTDYPPSFRIVLTLFLVLLVLMILLILLYRNLNKEANGEYTIQRIMFKEGGVRDQVRGAVLVLGTRLGVYQRSRSEADEDEEEMQEVRDEERQVEEGGSQGSDSETGDEEEEEDAEQCGGKGKEDDTSDDNSSLESSEAEEETRLTDQPKGETGETVGGGVGKGEESGGAGLLIDLKQFSGGAIWSEEEGGQNKDGDVTAL